jgi:hypothetical protein
MACVRSLLFYVFTFVAVLGVASALADGSSRPYGGGGRINPDAIIAQYNKSGERFRIEGSCQSSCTMLLAIRNVCVDPSARLLFHAALFPNEALSAVSELSGRDGRPAAR